MNRGPRIGRRPESPHKLLATLAAPSLLAARCHGKPWLWEDDDPIAIEAAERTCRDWCPELAKCEAWWLSLRPAQRPTDCVVAGQFRPPHKRRVRKTA